MRNKFLVLEEMQEFGPAADRAISFYSQSWKKLFDANKGIRADAVELVWTKCAKEAMELLEQHKGELLGIIVDLYHLGLPVLPADTKSFLLKARDLNRSLKAQGKGQIFSAAVRRRPAYEAEIFESRYDLSVMKCNFHKKWIPGSLEYDADRAVLAGLISNYLGDDIRSLSGK